MKDIFYAKTSFFHCFPFHSFCEHFSWILCCSTAQPGCWHSLQLALIGLWCLVPGGNQLLVPSMCCHFPFVIPSVHALNAFLVICLLNCFIFIISSYCLPICIDHLRVSQLSLVFTQMMAYSHLSLFLCSDWLHLSYVRFKMTNGIIQIISLYCLSEQLIDFHKEYAFSHAVFLTTFQLARMLQM